MHGLGKSLLLCLLCKDKVEITLWPRVRFLAALWKVKVLVAQLCPTLWDPVDYSPPGSSVHGILLARILEWVAISFFRGSSRPRGWTQVSYIAEKAMATHSSTLAWEIPGTEEPGSLQSMGVAKSRTQLMWLSSSSSSSSWITGRFFAVWATR